MKKKKTVETKSSEIITPVSIDCNYVSFGYSERNLKMINAVNPINQTVQPTANVIFTGSNVRTNACGCNGWLSQI